MDSQDEKIDPALVRTFIMVGIADAVILIPGIVASVMTGERMWMIPSVLLMIPVSAFLAFRLIKLTNAAAKPSGSLVE